MLRKTTPTKTKYKDLFPSSPTITNVRLYHVLIDGRAALNLIILKAFQKLQIPMSRLTPSRPFSGVGPDSIIPRGSISLPVTFGTAENYRTESVVLTSQRSTSPSMPSSTGRPYTSSWPSPTTGT
jgi:hypothetical protein